MQPSSQMYIKTLIAWKGQSQFESKQHLNHMHQPDKLKMEKKAEAMGCSWLQWCFGAKIQLLRTRRWAQVFAEERGREFPKI